MTDHADRLLAHIRAGVAELQRLERTGTNELELRRRRRTIAKLQWQLARLVSHHPGGGNLAA
ncbi:MAG: hypothetical protein QOE91_1573 [Gaiellaceae bacterium]|jgi:hypothetical protein|nr:hypothetical protein [Gaiellaceae bacterium]